MLGTPRGYGVNFFFQKSFALNPCMLGKANFLGSSSHTLVGVSFH